MPRARLDVHQLYGWLFRFWRERRFRLFVSLLQPGQADALLDVGGYPGQWRSRGPIVGSVDCVNTDPIVSPADDGACRVRAIVADGRALPFPDRAYQIAFSNSVIEHVGGDDDRRRFARELLRVGEAVWVQTPALACPIEPHFLTPFIHWLPVALRRRIARFSVRALLERLPPAEVDEMVRTTRLLRRREMEELFPGCEILTERLLFVFTKSYVAVRRRAHVRALAGAEGYDAPRTPRTRPPSRATESSSFPPPPP